MGSGGCRVVWALGGGVVCLGLGDGVERFGSVVSDHGGLRVAAVLGGLHGGV